MLKYDMNPDLLSSWQLIVKLVHGSWFVDHRTYNLHPVQPAYSAACALGLISVPKRCR